jgi:acyl-CoA thioesterase II
VNPVLAEIVALLNVEKLEENLFRGQNPVGSQHVFGGQVLAQATSAAYRTVSLEPRRLHSLHAYFLRPGDWNRPILYEVDRIRDGQSFTTRRVVATQHGKAIFSMSSSWQREETGLEHSVPMPDVPSPALLRSDKDVFAEIAKVYPEVRRFSNRYDAIDSRQVENIRMGPFSDAGQGVVHPPYKHTWMKTQERLADDPEIHLCMLAYMSDLDFMGTSMLPHGRTPGPGGNIQGASLDHAMWFHRPFRADEWLLFAKSSPSASGARGFVRGQFFNADGVLVATAAQECLIRVRASL